MAYRKNSSEQHNRTEIGETSKICSHSEQFFNSDPQCQVLGALRSTLNTDVMEYLKDMGDTGLKDIAVAEESNIVLLQARYRAVFMNHYINSLLAAIDENDIHTATLDKVDMQSFVDCFLLGTASERCAGCFICLIIITSLTNN